MLDKINNNNSETILQSQNLDRINALGVSNPFEDKSSAYFIDESNISSKAIEKYERELDVTKFSEILKQTDQKSADNLVLQQVFEGKYSIDDGKFLSELLDNKEFLNDIA